MEIGTAAANVTALQRNVGRFQAGVNAIGQEADSQRNFTNTILQGGDPLRSSTTGTVTAFRGQNVNLLV